MKTNTITSLIALLLFSTTGVYSQQQLKQDTAMKTQTKTVVFITGAFVSNNSWNEWKTYFESKGYNVLAPAWPGKEGSPDSLRRAHTNHTDSTLAGLTMAELVAYYENIVRSLPEKPILIGHSLGGLITQILLQKNIAAAGVAVHSAPPKGVVPLSFNFLKSAWKPFGLFKSANSTHLMSFEEWQWAFSNGQTEAEQRASYELLAVPESRRVVRDGISDDAKVDFKKQREPLLFIAGTKDHFFSPKINYSNYKKYKNNNSVTEYKVFEGINHGVLGLPTWHMQADYILDWISKY
jgi:pimeloyl-ACP methyl ester carboxylesterase